MKLYRTCGSLIGQGPTLRKIIRECKPDLSYADLIGADLRCFDLSYVDLHGAKLCGANLHKADLVECNLRAADLSGANLNFVNVGGADFRYTDLSGTGCVAMQCGSWPVWITPERCWVGCKRYDHDFWLEATPESVDSMHAFAKEFWTHWGEMIKAACRACAKHGWPEIKNEA